MLGDAKEAMEDLEAQLQEAEGARECLEEKSGYIRGIHTEPNSLTQHDSKHVSCRCTH